MRAALYLQDMHPVRQGMEYARYAEERGFEAVWQAESGSCARPPSRWPPNAAVTSRIKIVLA